MKDKAIRKIVNGVSIIGTKSKGKINALTAAWVSRVSFDPPLIMVSIGEKRYTLDIIKDSKIFSVNILGKSQVNLAKHFGFQSGRDINKFKNIDYETGKTGSPLLKDCIAWMDCKLISEHKAGDHTVLIGEVIDEKAIPDEEALIYDHDDYK